MKYWLVGVFLAAISLAIFLDPYLLIFVLLLGILYYDYVPERGSPQRPIKAKKKKVKVRRVER